MTDHQKESEEDSRSDGSREHAEGALESSRSSGATRSPGSAVAQGVGAGAAIGGAVAQGNALGASKAAVDAGAGMSEQREVERAGRVTGSALGAGQSAASGSQSGSARGGAMSQATSAAAFELEDFSDWGAPAAHAVGATERAISSSRSEGSRDGGRQREARGDQGPSRSDSAYDTAMSLLGGDEHSGVHFRVEFGDDVGALWSVDSFTLRESLGYEHRLAATLSTDELGADASLLLGISATVVMERGALHRAFSGIVIDVELGGSVDERETIDISIVPAFYVLGQGRDSRVFQDKTIPAILEEVLSEALEPYQREVRFQLEEEYPVCEYRTQYEESDHAFSVRLMAEAGIHYWFEQDGERETLVLSDDNSAFYEVESERGATLTFNAFEAGQDGHEGLRDFTLMATLQPTSLTMRHYDWTRPETPISEENDGTEEDSDALDGSTLAPRREHYEHDELPIHFHDYDEDQRAYTGNTLAAQRKLRREVQRASARVGRGLSNVTGIESGRVFELSGHQKMELDGRWLVVSASHHGNPSSPLERYSNEFQAIPADTPFRMPRRPKPRIYSVQTALVVGPSSDEIHTDEYGRIKVQFHWDRKGEQNEHSSCYLRVSQPWAGGDWGFSFLPRIGMEVIVSFINGDPDRPLVTGTVYNGVNTLPYTLPDEMTKSVIRTRSTPGGGADEYNELRFEDQRGEEEVFLQAQKDLNIVVKNDHSNTIEGSQTNRVSGAHTESVGGNQELTVKGERKHTVEKDEIIRIHGSYDAIVRGDESHRSEAKRDVRVVGESTATYDAKRVVNITSGDLKEYVKSGHRIIETEGKHMIRATEEYRVSQNNAHYLQLLNKAVLASQEKIELTAGGAGIEISSDGELIVSALSKIKIQCGAASIELNADGSIAISGAKNVALSSGASSCDVEPGGVTTTGPKVATTAIGICEIQGALIKIG